MKLKTLVQSLVITASISLSAYGGIFPDQIVSYAPGTGFAADFATKAGLTNAVSILGEPARSTPGQFGGPVDPFNPAYLGSQLVSIGQGGSLTVRLGASAMNSSANPYGIDFVIYGNAGFVITNGDFSGGGITDGSVFGANGASSKVSVSADGVEYFELTPSLAPVLDGPLPTDGSGIFGLAADPKLTGSSFSGKDLAGIRKLYSGSAGGTGFDLAWAQDSQGRPFKLDAANYVRIDVLSKSLEITGFAVAVPEPKTAALIIAGALGLLFCKRSRFLTS